MAEIKDIAGYEGLYKADSNGDIYNAKTMKKLKLSESHHGYKRIMLFKNGAFLTITYLG